MATKFHQIFTSLVASALLFASGAGVPALAADASITILPTSVTISPPLSVGNLDTMLVRIMSPDDEMVVDERSDGGPVIWSSAGAADGSYRYEVYVLVTGVEPGNELHSRTSGTLRVANGMISQPSSEDSAGLSRKGPLTRLFAAVLDTLVPAALAQNLTSSSSAPLVVFDDTSTAGLDWEIRSGNAGLPEPFWLLRDLKTGFDAFDVISSANVDDSIEIDISGDIHLADDSFFLDRSGNRIGIGTITPAVNGIHAFAASTKTNMEIRLENTSRSTWDFGQSSGGDFFFEIVANGAGGPTGTMMGISDNTGYVGIGTLGPAAPLEVTRTDGASQILVDENSASVGNRTLFALENNGGVRFDLFNTNRLDWFFQNDQDGTFKISRIGSGGAELIVRDRLDGSAGQATMFVDGSIDATNVNFSSSQEKKTGIERVEVNEILAGVSRLPVSRWRFKEGPDREHIGPMAEDFREVFGIGDGTHISVTDAQGIALAAIQGLHEQNRDLRDRIDSKDGRIATLETELNDLKVLVQALVAKDKVAAVGTMQ